MSTDYKERRFSDSIETSDGKWVRISNLHPDKIIKIGSQRISVRVGDIPMNAVALSCGDMIRGIALSVGDIIFCENHQTEESVASDLGS